MINDFNYTSEHVRAFYSQKLHCSHTSYCAECDISFSRLKATTRLGPFLTLFFLICLRFWYRLPAGVSSGNCCGASSSAKRVSMLWIEIN